MKKALVAAVLSLGLFSSCLGPNKLFNKLHDWNLGATQDRWANEGIFLVLSIVPVYSLSYAIDVVILNSIEFWSGKNPMDGK
ncbi:MAG: DUF3332 family protein [Planctomycetes bacterium]|nr:DUF3332 family protein [Planctomycetota bacterium]